MNGGRIKIPDFDQQLLNQNVSLIYGFIQKAVALTLQGRSWEALGMLRLAGALMFRKKDKDTVFNDLIKDIESIKAESYKIMHNNHDTEDMNRQFYMDQKAGEKFPKYLEGLRDYMQDVGYYTLMNSAWNFYDQSGGRKSE